MPQPRKTRDVWEVHGDYGYGFEMVTAEMLRSEAKVRLSEYRDNEPGYRFKLVRTRERIAR